MGSPADPQLPTQHGPAAANPACTALAQSPQHGQQLPTQYAQNLKKSHPSVGSTYWIRRRSAWACSRASCASAARPTSPSTSCDLAAALKASSLSCSGKREGGVWVCGVCVLWGVTHAWHYKHLSLKDRDGGGQFEE